jgi:hypothetical protein
MFFKSFILSLFYTIDKAMDHKEFQIRTYGFGELAQLYFPSIAKASASRMFSQWINACPQLLQKLIETDWKKRSKYFTPKQVKVLVGHFDPPF